MRVAIIVLLLVVLGCSAAVLTMAAPRPEPKIPADICMGAEMRERVRVLMFEAIDAALKDHIEHIFKVWLQDDPRQTERMRLGAVRGIKAYSAARKGIEAWAPHDC